jgi:hypothetical protein
MPNPKLIAARHLTAGLQVVDQGGSPLVYNRAGGVQRLALVDPDAGDPKRFDRYFAPQFRTHTRGRKLRRLKKPVLEDPGASEGTVAFLDYHRWGGDAWYLDYIKTRQDHRGAGHARRLIAEFYKKHRRAELIHWGKVMQPAVWKLFKEYEKLGEKGRAPKAIGSKNF